jgi:CTP synthase
MALILVEHDTPEPALYGAMAAIVAHQRQAAVAHLPAEFAMQKYPDAVQHVTADGALVASGLVWIERIAGLPVTTQATTARIIEEARERHVVVPIAAGLGAQGAACAALLAEACNVSIAVEHVRVEGDRSGYRINPQMNGAKDPSTWYRDRFGRFTTNGPVSDAFSPKVRIVLVGAEREHRDAYPAAIAALGDAADFAGISLEVYFVSPIGLLDKHAAEIAMEADGILLPGGSDMANVAGQVLTARASIRRETPTLGLCLGMQTMTTAVVQQTLGSVEANLAEADPSAPIRTFVPIAGNLPSIHRLGEKPIFITPDSRLNTLLGTASTVRCNHRYKLNPDLVPGLQDAGLVVAARDATGSIAEAVELNGHPFFVGLQGHPELMSRKGAPHLVIKAFLEAALSTRIRRSGRNVSTA